MKTGLSVAATVFGAASPVWHSPIFRYSSKLSHSRATIFFCWAISKNSCAFSNFRWMTAWGSRAIINSRRIPLKFIRATLNFIREPLKPSRELLKFSCAVLISCCAPLNFSRVHLFSINYAKIPDLLPKPQNKQH